MCSACPTLHFVSHTHTHHIVRSLLTRILACTQVCGKYEPPLNALPPSRRAPKPSKARARRANDTVTRSTTNRGVTRSGNHDTDPMESEQHGRSLASSACTPATERRGPGRPKAALRPPPPGQRSVLAMWGIRGGNDTTSRDNQLGRLDDNVGGLMGGDGKDQRVTVEADVSCQSHAPCIMPDHSQPDHMCFCVITTVNFMPNLCSHFVTPCSTGHAYRLGSRIPQHESICHQAPCQPTPKSR